MARSRISIAKPDIVRHFEEANQRVYTRRQLEEHLASNRRFWRLTESMTVQAFVQYLLQNTKLQLHKFSLPNRPTDRYTWGDASTLELVQSLRPEGYFSHFTALQLHGLTDQDPKTIYLNFEQQSSGGDGELRQQSIDGAFKRNCRVSNNRTEFNDTTICLLNGRNTGCLGVQPLDVTLTEATVRATNVARTLIDIVVRPVYAGGIHEVAAAYDAAFDQFSVNRLAAYLKKLSFTYPYHQSIGFYLERTGRYSDSQLELLREFEMGFDFYLDHKMVDVEYVKDWRLFVPKGFK
jgi:predicted transcriptional regulator of viral defense system